MTINNTNWVSSLPSDWKKVKIGSHFKCRNVKVNDTDYPPLSVAKQGVVPQIETVAKTDANDNRKLVLQNDFVINSRSDRKESCGLSNLTGSVSLINLVLFQNGNDFYMPYVGKLFKNYGFAEEFYRWGHGIVADLWTTRWQEMKSIDIPLPPIDEQKRIADLLEEKSLKIDKLITNQEKQIAKLKEYKQALITKAVTKGLDPNAQMKDSGVNAIGLIPSTWNIKKAKYIFDSLKKGTGITKEDVKSNGNIQCIRYGEIYSKYDISFSEAFSKTVEDSIVPKSYLNYGDILFAGTGELVEEIGKNIVYLGHKKCLAGGDIIIGESHSNFKFLNYASYCSASQIQKSMGKTKLKVVHISSNDIGNIYIALPSLEEQDQIVTFLDKKLVDIEKSIQIKQFKISGLKEYKKSLIYEYVTGKKRVSL